MTRSLSRGARPSSSRQNHYRENGNRCGVGEEAGLEGQGADRRSEGRVHLGLGVGAHMPRGLFPEGVSPSGEAAFTAEGYRRCPRPLLPPGVSGQHSGASLKATQPPWLCWDQTLVSMGSLDPSPSSQFSARGWLGQMEGVGNPCGRPFSWSAGGSPQGSRWHLGVVTQHLPALPSLQRFIRAPGAAARDVGTGCRALPTGRAGAAEDPSLGLRQASPNNQRASNSPLPTAQPAAGRCTWPTLPAGEWKAMGRVRVDLGVLLQDPAWSQRGARDSWDHDQEAALRGPELRER